MMTMTMMMLADLKTEEYRFLNWGSWPLVYLIHLQHLLICSMYRQGLSLYVISFHVILLLCDVKIYASFQIYTIMFGLTLFGIDDHWLLFLVLCWRLAVSVPTVTYVD